MRLLEIPQGLAMHHQLLLLAALALPHGSDPPLPTKVRAGPPGEPATSLRIVYTLLVVTKGRFPMLKGFKEFVARGNVMDLAVAVIIGGAFGKIVTSFVN